MKLNVLIAEDSSIYGHLILKALDRIDDFRVLWAGTGKEAELLMINENIDIAVLEYKLPDSPQGEIIDVGISHNLPCIAIISDLNDENQEFVWSKKIVDYILKRDRKSVEYLIKIIRQLEKNKHTGILIVDDSKVAREVLKKSVETHMFKIYEASNGKEALDILEEKKDIKLVLTDFYMPVCDGFELTRKIRKKYTNEKLAIIGMSSQGNNTTAVRFIKYGANDFLNKPFKSDMLYCRINQNLQLIDQFEQIKSLSQIDYLTGLSNRRHLSETGNFLFENAKRSGIAPIVIMIDIDHFKSVNDTWGHDAGDVILRNLALIMKEELRQSDVISRFGGEEFCILLNNTDKEEAAERMDSLREKIESTILDKNNQISITVSMGLCSELQKDFEQMLKVADNNLYKAKNTGRNKIVY